MRKVALVGVCIWGTFAAATARAENDHGPVDPCDRVVGGYLVILDAHVKTADRVEARTREALLVRDCMDTLEQRLWRDDVAFAHVGASVIRVADKTARKAVRAAIKALKAELNCTVKYAHTKKELWVIRCTLPSLPDPVEGPQVPNESPPSNGATGQSKSATQGTGVKPPAEPDSPAPPPAEPDSQAPPCANTSAPSS